MKTFQTIWQDIRTGKNLDIYIAIVIALIVAILGVVGTASLTLIISAVLATLALVSNSLLVNRRENEEIRNALLVLNSTEGMSSRFLKHEYDRFGLRQKLQGAHTAFLWGPYLTTHILILRDVIEKCLLEGLQIRFIIMEPCETNIENENDDLKKNLERLKALRNNQGSGKLEIRVLNWRPPHTIIAIDPHLSSGCMFVRLQCFRVSNETRPTFELTRKYDGDWFAFYVEQFELAWKEAHEYNLQDEK